MNDPGLREQPDKLAATLVAPDRRTQADLVGFVNSRWDKRRAAMRAVGAIRDDVAVQPPAAIS